MSFNRFDDSTQGCLVLDDNLVHNSKGDFALTNGKVQILDSSDPAMNPTYIGISMLSKWLFSRRCGETLHLRDAFIECIGQEELTGTPERLQQLDILLNTQTLIIILESHLISIDKPR